MHFGLCLTAPSYTAVECNGVDLSSLHLCEFCVTCGSAVFAPACMSHVMLTRRLVSIVNRLHATICKLKEVLYKLMIDIDTDEQRPLEMPGRQVWTGELRHEDSRRAAELRRERLSTAVVKSQCTDSDSVRYGAMKTTMRQNTAYRLQLVDVRDRS